MSCIHVGKKTSWELTYLFPASTFETYVPYSHGGICDHSLKISWKNSGDDEKTHANKATYLVRITSVGK